MEVRIQAGVSFHRFAERLANEFSCEVPGFSFFSTETREEVQVGDEGSFVKCKLEMLEPPKHDDDIIESGEGEPEHSLDITVKTHAASMHSALPARRTTEQSAAVRRERNEARLARMKDLEKVMFVCIC